MRRISLTNLSPYLTHTLLLSVCQLLLLYARASLYNRPVPSLQPPPSRSISRGGYRVLIGVGCFGINPPPLMGQSELGEKRGVIWWCSWVSARVSMAKWFTAVNSKPRVLIAFTTISDSYRKSSERMNRVTVNTLVSAPALYPSQNMSRNCRLFWFCLFLHCV